MITFACKNIKLRDLISCSFNLSKTDYDVLMFMLHKQASHSVIGLSRMMKLERTTIQKAIKHLLEKQLVRRLQKNLESGGYQYFYEVYDKEELKSKIKQIVQRWHSAVEKEIDDW